MFLLPTGGHGIRPTEVGWIGSARVTTVQPLQQPDRFRVGPSVQGLQCSAPWFGR